MRVACVTAITLLNLDPPAALYEVERQLRADGKGDRRATVAEAPRRCRNQFPGCSHTGGHHIVIS